MPRTIRFHLDEHVDPAIAAGLRRRGIDVTTTGEVGLRGHSDASQAEFVVREQRVIFTQDADYLRMDAAGWQHPGIAYCQQQTRSVGETIRALVLIWEVLEPEDLRNCVEFL